MKEGKDGKEKEGSLLSEAGLALEEEVFSRSRLVASNLSSFDFVLDPKKGTYSLTRPLKTVPFQAKVEVASDGKVRGRLLDPETGDEYLAFRDPGPLGPFAAKAKEEYRGLLLEIRSQCFRTSLFSSPQTDRIAGWILDRYGDKPEFPFSAFPLDAVFRNPETKKWYGLVQPVKMGPSDKTKELLNVKLDPAEISSLLGTEGYLPAYHMSKKSWISLVLDESLPDEEIEKRIEESHLFSEKK